MGIENTTEFKKEYFDRPIISKEEDILNRKQFTTRLADTISSWDGSDSLIIGLYGDWGSGKTSIKNLVCKELEQAGKNGIKYVEFNPWQVSGFNQLAEEFFDSIGSKFGKTDKEIAKLWRNYAARLVLHKNILEVLHEFFGKVMPLLGGVLLLGGYLIPEQIVKGGVIILGAIACIVGLFKKTAAAISNFWMKKSSESLSELKRKLTEQFDKERTPTLVVIDDIDRLPCRQISLIFQLIKANADFPKLVYLVMFQKDTVSKALEKEYGEGEKFLGKIIQFELNVPVVDRAQINSMFITGIRKIIADDLWEKYFQGTSLEYIVLPQAYTYFKNLRDVKRFLTAFHFTNGLFAKQRYMDAHPADLLLLEFLRMFESSVYQCLPNIKTLLVGNISERDREGNLKELNGILDNLDIANRDSVESILRVLFPNVDWLLGGIKSVNRENSLSHAHRVASPEFFDNYFRLSVAGDAIPTAEIMNFVDNSSDKDALKGIFDRFGEEGRIYKFLQSLDDHAKDIPIQNAVPFITVLSDISDILPDDRQPFGLGSKEIAWRIAYFYLHQEARLEERGRILKVSFSASNSVTLLSEIIATGARNNSVIEALVSKEDLEELKKIFVAKISAKSDTDLINLPHFSHLLYRWKEWEPNGPVKARILKQIETKDGFFKILKAFSFKIYSSGHPYIKVAMSRDFLNSFNIFSEMKNASEKFAGSELAVKENAWLMFFRSRLADETNDRVESENPDLL